jgi:hypothetical protein
MRLAGELLASAAATDSQRRPPGLGDTPFYIAE